MNPTEKHIPKTFMKLVEVDLAKCDLGDTFLDFHLDQIVVGGFEDVEHRDSLVAANDVARAFVPERIGT